MTKRLRVRIASFLSRIFAPECPYCRQAPDQCRCDPNWWIAGV